jgi:soluble lytic murein transglycosylase-like protein
MGQERDRITTLIAAAIVAGFGIIAVLGDSQAQAGVLKNSVRVGDRSAMTILRTPKPGEKKRIRITPRRAAPAARAAAAPQSQAWFWDEHRTEADAAGPERWTAALESLQTHRASGSALFSEDRLRAIADKYETHIASAARDHGVSELLLLAVIAVESAGHSRAVSPKGARGLMQLIPATAKRFGVADSFDPAQNIGGGAAYLDWLLRNFGEDAILALAGYNAGEGAVQQHKGVPPYAETRDYVVKVFDALAAAQSLCRAPADTPRRACGWSSTPSS